MITTYDEFVKAVYNDRPDDQRIGQWAFNLLNACRSHLTHEVYGNPVLDPYYADLLLGDFLAYVAVRWDA